MLEFENEALHMQSRLTEMEHKVCRNRIPNEHRERIVGTFQDRHEDYLLVADTLVVNRSTARGIVALMSEKDVLTRVHVAAATM